MKGGGYGIGGENREKMHIIVGIDSLQSWIENEMDKDEVDSQLILIGITSLFIIDPSLLMSIKKEKMFSFIRSVRSVFNR